MPGHAWPGPETIKRKVMKTCNKQLFLAAESGGTKTEWFLVSSDGSLNARFRNKGVAAVQENTIPVEKYFREAAQEIFRNQNSKNVRSGYFSLGGPNVEEIKKAAQEILPFEVAVDREANGNLFMFCAPYFGYDAVVLAGTGTTAIGNVDGKTRFSGGWGPLWDDEGSAYLIGKEGISEALKSFDYRRESTALTEMLQEFYPQGDRDSFAFRAELKKKLSVLSREEIAALSQKVFEAWRSGDKIAGKIIQDAAEDLAGLARSTLHGRKNEKGNLKVLGTGGLFKSGNDFRQLCASALRNRDSGIEFIFDDTFSHGMAACLMALKQGNIEINHDIISRLKKSFSGDKKENERENRKFEEHAYCVLSGITGKSA